jgi:hypothetical protein
MKETAQFFRELAKRHRELADELHNEEIIRDLHRLADECDAKAEDLKRRVGAGATASRARRLASSRG